MSYFATISTCLFFCWACGYSHISNNQYLIARAHSSLRCTHSFYAMALYEITNTLNKKITIKTTNRRRKKEKAKYRFGTAKRVKTWSVAFFWYMFSYHKCIEKLLTATKNTDSSLVIIFIAQRPVSVCSRPFFPWSLSPITRFFAGFFGSVF